MPASRKSSRIASQAPKASLAPASASAPVVRRKRTKNRSNNRPVTSTKKIAKSKKAAKDEITKKIKNTYKVTASTGTNQSQIMNAIGETISGSQFLSASSKESKTIKDLLLPKLYGLKSTKVVRDILEVPAKPSTVQGPSLYGCGGTGLPVLGSTSSWFFPGTPAEKEAMKNSGLVFCWMSLVACTFKQGGGNFCGRGINHEMEHAMPCAGQVIGSLLAQSLNVGEDKHYRKHHVILFEVMKVLLEANTEDEVTEVKRFVYLIMRMIRRQQVTIGLPSISVTNQKKCQLNLLMMTVDPETLKVTLAPNESEVNNIMDSVGSSDKKGMILKPGKPVSFSPCGWCGVNNPESAFASPQRLGELYSTGYRTTTDQPDHPRIAAAVSSATAFQAKSQEAKRETLMTQCEKVCHVYNEMGEAMIDNQRENLSCFIISASIIVLSVIIKSTYKELGVETIHMPELFKWVNKAKSILSDKENLRRLLGKNPDGTACPGARWIIEQSQYLADESGNEVTANYLNFRDATIRDFVGSGEMSDLGGILAGGGGEEESGEEGSELGIELDDGPDIPVSGSTAPPTPGTPPGFYEWATTAAAGSLNFESLTEEINNCFKYGDSLDERENLGVEEYATLMFDYFERMSTDINPDFISGIEVKIDSLTALELKELYFTTFGLELEIIDEEQMEEDIMDQAALNRTFTSRTAAAMDALAASVPGSESGNESESEMKESQTLDFETLPVGYDSQSTDSEYFSESDEEPRFRNKEMEIEDDFERPNVNQFGTWRGGGGKKKSKKKTKRKKLNKRKKRKKNTKRKNTKRKRNKKNTKRKSNKKNTKRKSKNKNSKKK